jgi:hypothetical protein
VRRTINPAKCIVVAAGLLGSATPVDAEQPSIAIELNKLETRGSQCDAYFVITNGSTRNYQEFKLDLVLFRLDGVIRGRFAVDLAPLKPNKRVVKLFELTDTACDEIGSILINEAMGCKSDAEPAADCLNDVTVSSLTKVQLTK